MISKEEVEGLATLARLDLSEGEVAGLQKDISNILDYVGQVSAVSKGNGGDTYKQTAVSVSGIEDLKPILRNVMREDVPAGEKGTIILARRDALIEALPKKEAAAGGGFFNVVRKIIQKDE